MRESEHAAPSTVRRRLAALSSLFKHLVRHGEAARNPVAEIERPAINRDEGTTLAFAKAQARKMLDAPAEDTVAGLRDRALLSVGLQVRACLCVFASFARATGIDLLTAKWGSRLLLEQPDGRVFFITFAVFIRFDRRMAGLLQFFDSWRRGDFAALADRLRIGQQPFHRLPPCMSVRGAVAPLLVVAEV